MLPELVRHIFDYVVPQGMSWRTEYHLNVLEYQIKKISFKNIQHNYVVDYEDRYSILPSLKKYVYYSVLYKEDVRVDEFKKMCCSIRYREMTEYLYRYRMKMYRRMWTPYTFTYCLGRHIQCTLPTSAYNRLLQNESMRCTGYKSEEWRGCVPLESYRTECILNWSIY